jgi:hypothetical protein
MLNAYGFKHKHFCIKSQPFFVLGFLFPFLLAKGLITAVVYQLSSLFRSSVRCEIELLELEGEK